MIIFILIIRLAYMNMLSISPLTLDEELHKNRKWYLQQIAVTLQTKSLSF